METKVKKQKKVTLEPIGLSIILKKDAEDSRKTKEYQHAIKLAEEYVRISLKKDDTQSISSVRAQSGKFVALLYTALKQRRKRIISVSNITEAKKVVRDELGITELKVWLAKRKDSEKLLVESGIRKKVSDLWYFREPIKKMKAREYFDNYKKEVKDAFVWLKIVSGLKSQDLIRLRSVFMTRYQRWNSAQLFFSFLFSATLGKVRNEFSIAEVLECFKKMEDYDEWLVKLPECIKNVYGENSLVQNCFEHSAVISLIDLFRKKSNRTLIALKNDLRLRSEGNKIVSDFRQSIESAIRLASFLSKEGVNTKDANDQLVKLVSQALQKRSLHICAETALKYPWIIEWCDEVQLKRLIIADAKGKYNLPDYLNQFGGSVYVNAKQFLDQTSSVKDFLHALFTKSESFGLGVSLAGNSEQQKTFNSSVFPEDTLSSAILQILCRGMSVYSFVEWLSRTEKSHLIPRGIRRDYALVVHLIFEEVPAESIKKVITDPWVPYITKEVRLYFQESVTAYIKKGLEKKLKTALESDDI